MTRIALSLVSHTNVGKTTLARTLLGRDVGTVRDEAHVTDRADRYVLIQTHEGDTAEGHALELWDTPGFGDSARLARRLAQQGNAIGWFLTEVWDRFRDRPFWHTQQAIRHVRDEADVVLYLVNAAESPQDAGYVEPEMRVLHLIGKPVIVLLNQLGPPKPPPEEAAQVQRWRAHLAQWREVRDVLPLDAFARCWVQEFAWLAAVGRVLGADKHSAFAALSAAWQAQREAMFDEAMRVIAERIARAAMDRERVGDEGLRGKLRELGRALGVGKEGEPTPREAAMAQLAARLDADLRASNDRLIALHGLTGSARADILTRLAEHYALSERVSEGKAALWGGLITGALTGLKADIATGGLTMGGGLLTGGVLGALGAAGLARGVNVLRGADHTQVAWADEVLIGLVQSALLTYLAIAHYGRGRGEWVEGERPAHWQAVASEAVAAVQPRIAQTLAARADGEAAALGTAMQPLLAEAARQILTTLYPGATPPHEHAASGDPSP
jgi:hypothetical protein